MSTYDRTPVEQILGDFGISGVHEALNLIPEMADWQWQLLCADVEQQGFARSVLVDDDKMLIDGRARLQAGWAVGLDPTVERFQPVDTIAYVISENVQRHSWEEAKAQKMAKFLADPANLKKLHQLAEGMSPR